MDDHEDRRICLNSQMRLMAEAAFQECCRLGGGVVLSGSRMWYPLWRDLLHGSALEVSK